MIPTRRLAAFAGALAVTFGGAFTAGRAAPELPLAKAKPEAAAHEADAAQGVAVSSDGYRLDVATTTLAPAVDTAVAFTIRDARGRPVVDFDVAHERRMHVILVRRDFTGFQHVHPQLASEGAWRAALAAMDPGSYRLYADFTVEGEKHTLATDLTVPGATAEPPVSHPRLAATVDGYEVRLRPVTEPAGVEQKLAFEITRNGRSVEVDRYLGARGHLVALRGGDLSYLHVHAEDDELAFDATFPSAGTYQLFLQFEHSGAVHTAPFTLHIPEER
jgi:hypothetical protein